MTVKIDQIDPITAMQVLSGIGSDYRRIMMDCLRNSDEVYVGFRDETLVCVWGLTTSSFCNSSAYLWLWVSDAVEGNEFLFIRHSRIAVQRMLAKYPLIYGVVNPDKDSTPSTQRWLKFLGATFGQPLSNGCIPFEIRRP